MNRVAVEARVVTALEALMLRDDKLLELDVGERSIASRLAGYMQPLFPTYDVDVEYNRHELNPKRLVGGHECVEPDEPLIIPDVIVHARGHDRENLLVLELKKSTNPTPRSCDESKLEGILNQYGYRFGLLIDIEAGASRSGAKPRLQWINGVPAAP